MTLISKKNVNCYDEDVAKPILRKSLFVKNFLVQCIQLQSLNFSQNKSFAGIQCFFLTAVGCVINILIILRNRTNTPYTNHLNSVIINSRKRSLGQG